MVTACRTFLKHRNLKVWPRQLEENLSAAPFKSAPGLHTKTYSFVSFFFITTLELPNEEFYVPLLRNCTSALLLETPQCQKVAFLKGPSNRKLLEKHVHKCTSHAHKLKARFDLLIGMSDITRKCYLRHLGAKTKQQMFDNAG